MLFAVLQRYVAERFDGMYEKNVGLPIKGTLHGTVSSREKIPHDQNLKLYVVYAVYPTDSEDLHTLLICCLNPRTARLIFPGALSRHRRNISGNLVNLFAHAT